MLDAACNKRTPGTGCAAIEGLNAGHAILGASDYCVATHPSDVAVALVALDATMRVQGPQGDGSRVLFSSSPEPILLAVAVNAAIQ